jgi:hypothetical protein
MSRTCQGLANPLTRTGNSSLASLFSQLAWSNRRNVETTCANEILGWHSPRAARATDAPGRSVFSTILRFSAIVRRRRGPASRPDPHSPLPLRPRSRNVRVHLFLLDT